MLVTELAASALSTVGATLLVVALGALLSVQLADGGKRSVRGIGYITSFIMLPCLLGIGLGSRFSFDLLQHTWLALASAGVNMVIGYSMGRLGAHFGLVPAGYEPLALLGCLSCNAIAYPLALLMSLRHVSWWDPTPAVAEGSYALAETLMFVFNVVNSIALWGIGHRTVQLASQRREEAEGTRPPPNPEEDVDGVRGALRSVVREVLWPIVSPPIIASFGGVAVGLTPPLRWLVTDCPGLTTVVTGAKTIGDGCIPLTMMLLGCNLLASASAAAHREEAEAKAEEATAELDTAALTAAPAVAVQETPVDYSDGHTPPPASAATPAPPSSDDDGVMFDPADAAPPESIPHEPGQERAEVANLSMVPIEIMSPPMGSFADARAQTHPPAPVHHHRHGEEVHWVVAWRHWLAQARHTACTPSLWSPQTRFTIFVSTARLVAFPTIVTLLLTPLYRTAGSTLAMAADPETGAMQHVVDERRVLLMVLLLEAFSPSAINGSVICSLYHYKAGEHSTMLAVQYAVSVVSSVFWIIVVLWILDV